MPDLTANRNRHDPAWHGPNPATCDDVIWQDVTGMCGGCASEDCHPGKSCTEQPCVDPFYGYNRLLCDLCQVRIDQGWWLALTPDPARAVCRDETTTTAEEAK